MSTCPRVDIVRFLHGLHPSRYVCTFLISPAAAAVAKSILGLPESAQTQEIKDQISQLVKTVGKNAPPSVNRETVRDFIQNWPESNEFKNLFRGIYDYVKNMNMQPYTLLDIPDTIEGRAHRTTFGPYAGSPWTVRRALWVDCNGLLVRETLKRF